VLRGLLNKQIAHELGISRKTVEIHRHNAMEKMGASSAADLIRLLVAAGWEGDGLGWVSGGAGCGPSLQ